MIYFCHFYFMKNSLLSKIISLGLVLVLFTNPVFAMSIEITQVFSGLTASSASIDSESAMPCHQASDSENKQMPMFSVDQDCCDDICLCNDASCHGFSVVFQSLSSSVHFSTPSFQFTPAFYLSFITIPKSPPPII